MKAFFWVMMTALVGATACQSNTQPTASDASLVGSTLEYASTFALHPTDSGTLVTLYQPWRGQEQPLYYFLAPKGQDAVILPDSLRAIPVPVERLVCYSTTHMPYLDMLGSPEVLVAAPGIKNITTPSLRQRVEAGQVRDLGQDNAINVEVLLEVAPDLVMMYALNAPGDEYAQLQRTATPVIFNADYLEKHPLGRVEYIKLFGALLGREAAADSVFAEIKDSFLALSEKAPAVNDQSPTVFAGLVYGDIWYAPAGNSWAADFMARAGGRYPFADQKGSGSLQLSFETVYAQCLQADVWLNVGSFTELSELKKAEARYADFAAFQQGQVYAYMKGSVPNGGVPYFEEGYARPDKVLEDLIRVLHPPVAEDSLHYYVPLR